MSAPKEHEQETGGSRKGRHVLFIAQVLWSLLQVFALVRNETAPDRTAVLVFVLVQKEAPGAPNSLGVEDTNVVKRKTKALS